MRLVVFALLPALLIAGEAAAPVADPTGEEMAVLQIANLHRVDRVTGNNRISHMIRAKQVAGIAMFTWSQNTPKGQSPPLIVNPALTLAARALLKAGTKAPDKSVFDPLPAMREAGYTGDKGMAIFGTDASSLDAAYTLSLLNITGVKAANNKEMDVFAAAEALKAQWREVGIAVGVSKNRPSVVIVLGAGSAKRYLGGVVYADANRNLAYDPGEGKSGVLVSCGNASMTTGASGAWWLALDNETEGTVAFSGGGYSASAPFAKGAVNLTIDWRMPNANDLKTADKLIADAEKVAKNVDMEKKRVQLAALLTGTRMAALDETRQKQVATLVEPLVGEFDMAMSKVMESLGEEPADFKKVLGDVQKVWKNAMPAWFKEAENLSKLRQQVNKVLAAPEEQQGKLALPVLKQVQKAKAETIDPKFLAQYATWEEQLHDAMPAEPAAAAPKKK
jgi:hypothetical protein